MDMFNNDVRLRALKALAETLRADRAEEGRSCISAPACSAAAKTTRSSCARRSTPRSARTSSIYPVDTRGLQAVVPGGDATHGQRPRHGTLLRRRRRDAVLAAQRVAGHAGRARRRHRRARLPRLQRLRAGLRARAARHVGVLPDRLQPPPTSRRTAASAPSKSASSSRTPRSRRATATTPIATSSTPRAPIARPSSRSSCSRRSPATDLPVLVNAGLLPHGADRYYVPIARRRPRLGDPDPRREGQGQDGARRARRGAATSRAVPVGRHAADAARCRRDRPAPLAAKQVLYSRRSTLPPGRFTVKVVVRENTSGLMGSFEAPVVVPELKTAPLKVSAVTAEHAAAAGQGHARTIR